MIMVWAIVLLVAVSSGYSYPIRHALSHGHHMHAEMPDPTWLNNFTVSFNVLVEKFGSEWNSTGILYYNWSKQALRSDWTGWCPPFYHLNTSSRGIQHSCSFLAVEGNMYFVNQTAESWENNECCLVESGIGSIPPNWMKDTLDNGSAIINGVQCALWWYPGTNDPSNSCYGYWSAVDLLDSPVRFFEVTNIGPTILDYFKYLPTYIPPEIELELPNSNCRNKCQLSAAVLADPPTEPSAAVSRESLTDNEWPFKWPSC